MIIELQVSAATATQLQQLGGAGLHPKPAPHTGEFPPRRWDFINHYKPFPKALLEVNLRCCHVNGLQRYGRWIYRRVPWGDVTPDRALRTPLCDWKVRAEEKGRKSICGAQKLLNTDTVTSHFLSQNTQ